MSSKPEAPIGGIVFGKGSIVYNTDRPTAKITVHNTGDRPIQVGSHFHFFEVNRALEFDREAAFGMHLDIPSTTAVRFEPGDEKEVNLVAYSGKQYVKGFNGLVNNWTGCGPKPTYHPGKVEALRKMRTLGFKDTATKEDK